MRISDWSSDVCSSDLKIKSYIAHEFKLEVDAPAPGYLVVPMQYAEGWKAYRNDKQVSLRLIEGVLPAVQLPAGDSIVLFRYRPPNFMLGLAVSVVSLFRSDERRVGKEGVSTFRFRWSPSN